jgi:hypothetical protein
MMTKAELGVNVRKLDSNLHTAFITPCSTRGKNRNGRVGPSENSSSSPHLSSPMSAHAIARDLESENDEEDQSETAKHRMLRLGLDDGEEDESGTAKHRGLRVGVGLNDDWDPDSDDDESDNESVGGASVDDEVELEQEYQFRADIVVVPEFPSNLLLPEKELKLFIGDNFCCNLCSYPVKEVGITAVKVGFACSLFWTCSNPSCDKSDNIIAKTAMTNVSRSHKRYHRVYLRLLVTTL